MYIFSKIFKTKHFMQGNLCYACDSRQKDSRSKSGGHMWSWNLRCLLIPRLTSHPPPSTHPQTPSNSIGDWLYTLTQAEGTRLIARWARHWPSACWCWPQHFAPGPPVVGEVLGVQQVSVPPHTPLTLSGAWDSSISLQPCRKPSLCRTTTPPPVSVVLFISLRL